jgi:hypothetical protein
VKRSDAAKLWAMFATAYAEGLRWLDGQVLADGRTQYDETADLYQRFMLDLPYEAADAAVRRLIATWQPTSANRYPSIPTLRAAVLAQQTGRRRSGIEAWGDLRKMTGSYEESRFDEMDPIVRQCLDALGWIEWSPFFSAARGEFMKWKLVLGENEAADRARFVELYDRIAAAQHEDTIVGALAPPLPRRQMGAGVAALLREAKERA